MQKTIKDYFEMEFSKVITKINEFARENPGYEDQLQLGNYQDPNSSLIRLLEGFAYLSAEIRQRLDDDFPDICQTLLQQLCPELLRPYPSSTVINFRPRNKLEQSKTVKRGTEVKCLASDSNKQSYRFQTSWDLVVRPLRIETFRAYSQQCSTIFEIDIKVLNNANLQQHNLSYLDMFLNGDFKLTSLLYYAWSAKLQHIQIEFEYENNTICVTDGIKLLASNLRHSRSLNPCENQCVTAQNHLLDYFSFRDKYMFFDILGLAGINWPAILEHFTIKIFSSIALPENLHLSTDHVQLHCVPAVNIFKSSSVPIRLDHKYAEYPIIIDDETPDQMMVYKVASVIGIENDTGLRHIYRPIQQHQYSEHRYYQLYHRNLVDRDIVYIALAGYNQLSHEIISCDLIVTNGHWPRRHILPGTPFTTDTVQDNYFDICCVTRATPTYLPRRKKYYHWQLLAYLKLSFTAIKDGHGLQKFLHMYLWSKSSSFTKQIESIETVTLRTFNEIRRGALIQGIKYMIDLDQTKYDEITEIYMLGSVLHMALSTLIGINQVLVTEIHCQPSGEILAWNSQQIMK